jgi:hypothetical protein
MAYTPGSGGEWSQCDYSDERCIKFDVIVPDFGKITGQFYYQGTMPIQSNFDFSRDGEHGINI